MSLRGLSGIWKYGEDEDMSAMALEDLSTAGPPGEGFNHLLSPQHSPLQSEGNSQLIGPGVSVVDYVCPNGVGRGGVRTSLRATEEMNLSDPQSFSNFLNNPRPETVVSRIITISNVTWALPIIMRYTGRTYDTFPIWMEAPFMVTNPREKVWHHIHDNGYHEIKFAFDYFGTHTTTLGNDACADTALTTLRYSEYDPREPVECRVCPQKIGVILYWDGTDCAAEVATPVVAILVQYMGKCPAPYWKLPHEKLGRYNESRLGPLKFSHIFLKDVMFWVVRGTTQRWFLLIRRSHSYYAMFEKEIFKDPENEAWGEDLWHFSRNWSVYNRLFMLHVRMVEYLEFEAKCFLEKYWQQRTGHALPPNSEQMGTSGLFGRLPAAFEANNKELKEGLMAPTMNMLDMIYKRVAIRDARHSLMLNESLWRLSWITFIFLPLTFITGIFGMNVDTFADNPSIKWWFVVTVPLMSFVFVGWFLFRRSYAAINQAALRRDRMARDRLRRNF